MNSLLTEMAKNRAFVEEELQKRFGDPQKGTLGGLLSSEAYSMLAGGKRIRPLLTLAFAELFGGKMEAAMPFAVAVEMIHTASLIHDDLPMIDNDDYRRGRLTNHKVYGESTALLAADALLMDAFGVVASNKQVDPVQRATAVELLSSFTGTYGLVGGEFIDIMGEKRKLELSELRLMDLYKTAALIKASCMLGAIAAGVPEGDQRLSDAALYSENIGIAFQITDDVLDVIGDMESLGKTPGKDLAENKTTYLSFYTVDEATAIAKKLSEDAINVIKKYEGSEYLVALARHLTKRMS